jgi:hypothetical protein
MTKAAGKISETDYGFNYLVVMQGVIHDILYYSKYGWQNSGGTYIENSSSDSDLLVADTTEYELFVKHGVRRGTRFTNSAREEIEDADREFEDAVSAYNAQNPDESQLMVSTYHYYGHSAG